MGQIVRDLGMVLLVGLVIHTLYAARQTRSAFSPPPPSSTQGSVYQPPKVVAVAVETPPEGFSVFPWAP